MSLHSKRSAWGPTLQHCHTENNANAFGWAGSGIPECLVVGTIDCVLLQRNVGDGDKIWRIIIYIYVYMQCLDGKEIKTTGYQMSPHNWSHLRSFSKHQFLLASLEKLWGVYITTVYLWQKHIWVSDKIRYDECSIYRGSWGWYHHYKMSWNAMCHFFCPQLR